MNAKIAMDNYGDVEPSSLDGDHKRFRDLELSEVPSRVVIR